MMRSQNDAHYSFDYAIPKKKKKEKNNPVCIHTREAHVQFIIQFVCSLAFGAFVRVCVHVGESNQTQQHRMPECGRMCAFDFYLEKLANGRNGGSRIFAVHHNVKLMNTNS